MGSKVHDNDGLDVTERFARANSGQCPVCGNGYDDVVEVEREHSDRDVPGLAYDHDHGPLCIEWADGKVEHDA